MINESRSIGTAAGYARETIQFAKPLAISTVAAGQDQPTRDFLAKTRPIQVAAMGLIAASYYDIIHPGSSWNATDRTLAKVNGAHTMLVYDTADDIVDERRGSLAEKRLFLNDITRLISGETPITSIEELRSDPEKAAVVDIARRVQRAVKELQPDQATTYLSVLRQVCNQGVNELDEQFSETDPHRLLDLTKRIGASGIDLIQVHVDLVDGRIGNESITPERQAGCLLGSYALLLDHLYELDHDLGNGQNTYGTVRVRKEGDSPELRREIHDVYLDLANDIYKQGKDLLTPEQAIIYGAIRILLDVKYKILARYRGKSEEAKRAPVAATIFTSNPLVFKKE